MKEKIIKSPWGNEEKKIWFLEQKIQRSYFNDVVSKLNLLKSFCELKQYGSLSIESSKYPLFSLVKKSNNPSAKNILITGGVHGYETSGVHGSLLFMEKFADSYLNDFNFYCFPCLSPWSYETVNRWNHLAIDPNRSFYENSPAEECKFFLDYTKELRIDFYAHFDLHETTDTDNTVFRPALESRDGIKKEISEIPDGFYLVGRSDAPRLDFQKAIIEEVKKITHIAPADADGNLIGEKIPSDGIVYYDMKKLFLCGGYFNVEYSTTTEVYPDSPKVTQEICNLAQVHSIIGGLNFILKES